MKNMFWERVNKKFDDIIMILLYLWRLFMLVLSRKIGESIIIGDNIEVTLCSINGQRVKFGITCPKEIRVDRKEIREKIEQGKANQADMRSFFNGTESKNENK